MGFLAFHERRSRRVYPRSRRRRVYPRFRAESNAEIPRFLRIPSSILGFIVIKLQGNPCQGFPEGRLELRAAGNNRSTRVLGHLGFFPEPRVNPAALSVRVLSVNRGDLNAAASAIIRPVVWAKHYEIRCGFFDDGAASRSGCCGETQPLAGRPSSVLHLRTARPNHRRNSC